MAAAATVRRRSRATHRTDAAAPPDLQAGPAGPEPVITVEAVPVPYHRPTVVLPNGETIVCQHRYLHETEKAAAACGRRIAAAGAFIK